MTQSTTRVFIGIPTLNRPAFVRETISSVRAQSRTDLTVVISDNCSDGDAAHSVKQYIQALDDHRLRFHRQPTNVGEYGQGRCFFEQAKAFDYFMILHDDDVLNREYLQRAVDALDANPGADFFVANPYLFSGDGVRSDRETHDYLASHGRLNHSEGLFDVLSEHLRCGFAPISGTLFRTCALERSGFVDEDCHGNYPFEANIFLRLGEHGAKGYFCADELIGFRYHRQSLRNYLNLLDNPDVVDTMTRVFARRQFSGANEKRRRTIVSRLRRAQATIALREHNDVAARRHIVAAIETNPWSARAWLVAPWIWLTPNALRKRLSPAVQVPAAPAPQPCPLDVSRVAPDLAGARKE